MSSKLTHLDESGNINMVDVSSKPDTARIAVARGEIRMRTETLDLIRSGNMKKGDVLTTAKLAGIIGAKRTSELIPLCHPIMVNKISIDLNLNENIPGIEITATVHVLGKTGVEMEALTAVAISALTIYDMAKAVEKTMVIQNIRIIEKRGGASGDIKNR